MRLENITFILENCDLITIDGKYVGDFIVDDIQTSISRVACNAIMRMDVANLFMIEIHKDANVEHNELGCLDFNIMKFDRLLGNDITAIEFDLVDTYAPEGKEPKREHYDYYVHWSDESEYVNGDSHSFISKLGHLYIFIGSKEKYERLGFREDEVNDEQAINFKFEMYAVGDKNYAEEQALIKKGLEEYEKELAECETNLESCKTRLDNCEKELEKVQKSINQVESDLDEKEKDELENNVDNE